MVTGFHNFCVVQVRSAQCIKAARVSDCAVDKLPPPFFSCPSYSLLEEIGEGSSHTHEVSPELGDAVSRADCNDEDWSVLQELRERHNHKHVDDCAETVELGPIAQA